MLSSWGLQLSAGAARAFDCGGGLLMSSAVVVAVVGVRGLGLAPAGMMTVGGVGGRMGVAVVPASVARAAAVAALSSPPPSRCGPAKLNILEAKKMNQTLSQSHLKFALISFLSYLLSGRDNLLVIGYHGRRGDVLLAAAGRELGLVVGIVTCK